MRKNAMVKTASTVPPKNEPWRSDPARPPQIPTRRVGDRRSGDVQMPTEKGRTLWTTSPRMSQILDLIENEASLIAGTMNKADKQDGAVHRFVEAWRRSMIKKGL